MRICAILGRGNYVVMTMDGAGPATVPDAHGFV